MAFHSHGRLGEAVPAGGRNGRDGRSAPSGEWVVNEDDHGRILENHPMAFHSHGRLGEAVPAGGRNGRDGLSEPSGE
jgi:hypothetical protein